jgi:autotransporter-associated beta strand protein
MKFLSAPGTNFGSLRFKKHAGVSCAVFLALLALGGSARAVNYTWNNTGTNFNGTTEWNGGVAIVAANVAYFNVPEITNPNLASSFSSYEVFFGTATAYGYDLTASASATLTLTNSTVIAGANTVGTNTIAAPLILSSTGTQLISQAEGGVLVLSGTITGGSQTIAFQGATSVSGGVIEVLGTSNTLGGPIQIGNSGAPVVVQVESLSNGTTAGSLGTGTITIGQGNNFVGGVLNYIGSGQTTTQVIDAGTASSGGSGVDTIDTTGETGPLIISSTISGAIVGTGSAGTGGVILNLANTGTASDEITGNINNGSGSTAIATLGVEKSGTGTWTLAPSTADSYTGTTTLLGGTLNLNFANIAASTSIVNGGSNNNLLFFGASGIAGSETLELTGKDNTVDTQSFLGNTGTSTTSNFNGGAAHIILDPGANGSVTLTLNNVGTGTSTIGTGWNSASTVDFTLNTSASGSTATVNAAGTTVSSTSGELGGAVTINETNFATVSSGTLTSDQANYAEISSGATALTAGKINDLATGMISSNTGTTVPGLRFGGAGGSGTQGQGNSTGGTTLTVTGTLTVDDVGGVAAGAILVSTTGGAYTYDITGGSITGYNGRALDLLQYDASGTLQIDSNIVPDAISGVTKSGTGVAILTGNNTYEGSTYINEGTVRTTSATALGFGGPLLNNSYTVGNTQVASGATLDLAPTATMTVNEPIQLLGGSLINSGSGTATLDNGVAGVQWTGSGGGGTTGTYTATITTNPNGYNPNNTGSNAALTYVIGSTGSLTSLTTTAAGSGYVNSPIVTLPNGPTSGLTYTAVLSSLALSGQNNQIGGPGGLVINASVINSAGTTATGGPLPTGYSAAETNALGGFTKIGSGTVTLTGTNAYAGGTTISAGTLLANGTASALTTSQVGTQTNSTNTLTGLTSTANLVVGESVSGGSYGAGVYISSINSSSAVTLTATTNSSGGGTNTYTFGAYGATGAGGIAVNGGVFGGDGAVAPTFGGITVAAAGNITPGTTPSGTAPGGFLTVTAATAANGISFAASSSSTTPQLTFNLGTGSAPSDSSTVTFAGASSYIKLAMDTPGEVAFNTTYLSLNNLAGGSLSGNYLLFQAGANTDYTGLTTSQVGSSAEYLITAGLAIASNSPFAADSLYEENGDIFLTAASVPEPSTWALLFSGLFLVVVWRRRASLVA